MTSIYHLIRVANKLANKYAMDGSEILPEIQQALQTAVANASTQSNSGIMPFLKILNESAGPQNVYPYSIDININRKGDSVYVDTYLRKASPLLNTHIFDPLSDQIKNYLEKNLGLFPMMKDNQAVTYDDVKVMLHYGS